MAIVMVGNVDVAVRSRGEHCPPHVHADCAAEKWDSRFRFSFVDDDIVYWDTRARRNCPTKATLNRIGQAVYVNLAQVRKRWWEVMATTCLENRHVLVVDSRLVVCEPATDGVVQVVIAAYDPDQRTLSAKLSNGIFYYQKV